MSTPAVFHQMFTGKTITILDKTSVGAIVHGTATSNENKTANCVFLLIDKVATPVAVRETEEEVLALLGLSTGDK